MRTAPRDSTFLPPGLRAVSALGLACCLALLSACGGSGDTASNAQTGSPASSGSPNASADPETETPAPPPPVPKLACGDLSGKTIAAADIGLPSGGATITEATAVAAGAVGNLYGDYCKVRGTIAPVNPASPVINFALNLPINWNRKTIHFGGGGFNGNLIDVTEPIRFGPADKPAPLLAYSARPSATFDNRVPL